MESLGTILYFAIAFLFAVWARAKGKSGLFHFLLALLGPLGWIISALILGPRITTLVRRVSEKSRLKPHEFVENETRKPFPIAGPGDFGFEVVGESNYVDTIASLFSNPKGDQEIFLEASLKPEPTNQHDPKAIRVVIRGRTVGYIARDRTAELHPILSAIESRDQVAAVRTRVYLGKDEFTDEFFGSVWLDLPYELELALPLNQPAEMKRIWPAGASVAVSLSPEGIKLLGQAMAKSAFQGKAAAYFGLLPAEDSAGKPIVEVTFEGAVVGVLTATRGKKLHPFLAQTASTSPFLVLGRITSNSISAEVSLGLKNPEQLSETEIKALGLAPGS